MDLEAEDEIVRGLVHHALKVLAAGEGVICGIDADGFEDLGVLAQALALEPGLGELAPVLIAGGIVEHPAPAWILPR